jgi:hypothetical protein
MRKVFSNNYDIAGFESAYAVTNEFGTLTFFDIDEFNFGMIMPPVIDREEILPYTKRAVRTFGNL